MESNSIRLLGDAQTSLNDFQRLQNSGSTGEKMERVNDVVKWWSPPSNMVKLNWDAGLNVTCGPGVHY
jgi:hypothetical protein